MQLERKATSRRRNGRRRACWSDKGCLTQPWLSGAARLRVQSERHWPAHPTNCLHPCPTVLPTLLPMRRPAAIKVTALGLPELLERTSNSLLAIRDLFRRFDTGGP